MVLQREPAAVPRLEGVGGAFEEVALHEDAPICRRRRLVLRGQRVLLSDSRVTRLQPLLQLGRLSAQLGDLRSQGGEVSSVI